MITLFQSPAVCCGCGACAVACPMDAITMMPDASGALYPVIRQEWCIACGQCLKTCSFLSPQGTEPLAAYGAVGQDGELVSGSASGGVFATLAKACIQQGGMAAGAVMDWGERGARVFHILSDSLSDIPEMQGSKYVQSRAYACYKNVIRALKTGKTVLFSGTPCQVQAIKALTGDPENLITADLVCHGVPPEEMLNGFCKLLGKRLGGRVEDFCFRDKNSPKSFTARIRIRKGRKTRIYRLRSGSLSFYQYFLEAESYRESCYSCPYASTSRVSDLTMGDYWGMEKYHAQELKNQPDRKNWSCLLVNTQKGRSFLEQMGGELYLLPTQTAWVAQTNAQLTSPSQKGTRRETILETYAQGGYPAVEKLFIKDHGGSLRFRWRMFKLKRQG